MKFQERWDERGCMHMGIYVLPGVTVPKGAEARAGGGCVGWRRGVAADGRASFGVGVFSRALMPSRSRSRSCC